MWKKNDWKLQFCGENQRNRKTRFPNHSTFRNTAFLSPRGHCIPHWLLYTTWTEIINRERRGVTYREVTGWFVFHVSDVWIQKRIDRFLTLRTKCISLRLRCYCAKKFINSTAQMLQKIPKIAKQLFFSKRSKQQFRPTYRFTLKILFYCFKNIKVHILHSINIISKIPFHSKWSKLGTSFWAFLFLGIYKIW